jgi:multisite-specific tRNA:(cytosine-C5)-methyltransferase
VQIKLFVVLTVFFSQGGKGRGGGGAGRTRSMWQDLTRENEKFERYYNELEFIPEEERELFWATMRKDLPNSFRFTGSRGYVASVSFLCDSRLRV